MTEKIGFIGLGIMGIGMTKNLISKGHAINVWNRTARKMDELVALGAEAADTPKDIAKNNDIIMICVSDTPDVKEVIFGDDGVIHGVLPGKLVIDHSTISPHTTIEIAGDLEKKGVYMLDAPISGGSEGARKGSLSIMVGGDQEQFDRAYPYLTAIGKTITHVGPQGSGQLVKLVNQILVVVNQLAASEALLLAQAGNLNLSKTLAAVESGAAGSWMLSNRGPQMIVRDWRPGFTIDLQQKDLRLVLEAADQLGIPLIATSLVFNLYRSLQKQGRGGEGNHALVKALENMSGIKIGDPGLKD